MPRQLHHGHAGQRAPPPGARSFRLIRCDVTDFVHVPGEVDLVLHFASPASPIDYLKLPIHTLKVGAIGTWHARPGEGQGCPVRARVHSEVYGDPQVHPQPESYWGTSTPSVRAACTTRASGTARR